MAKAATTCMPAPPISYATILGFFLAGTALLIVAPVAAAYGQSTLQREYMISVGNPSERIASGTIWLYSYSWYGLQKIQLASIHNGLALVPSDVETLKRQLDPTPTTEEYLIALQIGEHAWYRTPNIPPNVFWKELFSALNSLGRATPSPTGGDELILPLLSKRHVTLIYPDGKPATNANVPLSIYIWDTNHCGVHQGLPLGNFRSDQTGTIEVLAPLLPLYLDGIAYYENAGTGPAGISYSHNTGLKTGPEENVVLKQKWELTEEDSLLEDVELRVLTPTGQPRKNVDVYGNWQTNTCGGADRIGRTNSKGLAQISVDPSFTDLELVIGGPYSADDPEAKDKSRKLTYNELRELFAKQAVTIRW